MDGYNSKLESTQDIELETLISREDVLAENASKRSIYTSWRFSLICGAALAVLVFIANVVLLIYTSINYPVENNLVTLYNGSCDTMETIFTGTHLGINVLSTLLLSASNVCMQCLAAPTRSEVDRQHACGKWLDIGVMSFRNLWAISRWRLYLWICLALSSIPLHLLYNSVIFSTTSANDYLAAVVSPTFLGGQLWNSSSTSDTYYLETYSSELTEFQTNASTWRNLTNFDCIQAYHRDFVQDYQNVLLVSTYTNTTDPLLDLYEVSATDPSQWYCLSDYGKCNIKNLLSNAEGWQDVYHDMYNYSVVHTYPIDYCLAQPSTPSCKIQLGQVMLIVVIICNIVKVICIMTTIFHSDFRPLITIGDALASFLNIPDDTTATYGPIMAYSIRKREHTWLHTLLHAWIYRFTSTIASRYSRLRGFSASQTLTEPDSFQCSKRYRWFRAASVLRWTVAGCLFCTIWFTALSLLVHGLHSEGSTVWSTGLGSVSTSSLISFNITLPVGSAVLIANTPQILVSFLYVIYNNLFTCMLSAAEISDFSEHQKGLRVSEPNGQQRSTYWLSLPYRYAIPLMLAMGTLHWFISQSIFLARVSVFHSDGVENESDDISACGWSATGLAASLSLGAVMIVVVFGFGFRKFPAGIPVISNCSIALSAACHPLKGDVGIANKAIRYGVLREEREDEHEIVGFGTDVKRSLVEK